MRDSALAFSRDFFTAMLLSVLRRLYSSLSLLTFFPLDLKRRLVDAELLVVERPAGLETPVS